MASYTFSHPASPDDIHSSTRWHQELAGSGRHTEWMQRGRAERVGQLYALPVLPNPLHAAAEFAAEVARDEELHRRSVIRSAVVGGVLSYALVRAVQNRGRR